MNKNEIFALWISNDNQKELPRLAHLSLKSMILCGHDVVLYTYSYLDNIPEGVKVLDANEILDSSRIFMYNEGPGTYSGFANLFRLHRLYKYGGTWLDLDVLLIRNVNEKFGDDILIGSEPTIRFYLHPTNSILRFPKHDLFVKYMLDYAEEVDRDIVHGQTGPRLVTNALKKFPEYNQYLKHFNIHCLLEWKHIGDYTKSPKRLLNKINMDEVLGFHVNNAFFEEFIKPGNSNGLFEILENIILISDSYDEYREYLEECGIMAPNSLDGVRDWDLKYLDLVDDNYDNKFKFTILIDSRNLRKVEIYNIIHSIGFGYESGDLVKTMQIIIFGKTNIGCDKVRFKENVMLLASDFEDIYPYIEEYVYGEYIIPLNQPVIFSPNFFKDKLIQKDIEHYCTNDNMFVNILNKNAYRSILYEYGGVNLFNLNEDMLEGFSYDRIEEDLIFNYESKSSNVNKLISVIDELNHGFKDDISSHFLNSKFELKEMEFDNLIDEVSYHYYSSYLNIIESSSFHEFKLKEQNTRLNCLNGFYLNKLNNKY